MPYMNRANRLMRICPEYAAYINANRLSSLHAENPSLSIASSVFIFCESAQRGERLIFELNSWIDEPNTRATMPDACTYLARFFAESNEPEHTMVLLRWMQENGYTADELEPFRL